MNVERYAFDDDADARFDARLAATIEQARGDPRFSHVFEPVDEEAELTRARADIEAGRFHDHAIVAEWLKTWGTPERKSFHEWLKQAKS